MGSAYIGRERAIAQLQNVLTGQHGIAGKLVIQSVEGPGGIGKTALFDHVLSKTPLASRNYLTMRITGTPDSRVDAFQCVQELIASSRAPIAAQVSLREQFSYTDEVRNVYDELITKSKTQLSKRLPEVPVDVLMTAVRIAISFGKGLNDLSETTKPHLNVEKLEKYIPKIESTLKDLKPLLDEVPGFLDKLGVKQRTALRNNIRKSPLAALSNAFETDLSTLLAGYRRKDWWRPTQKKIKGTDRLLIVVDDFESLSDSVGEFLVSHLVPGLKYCEFETVLVIIGRDQLALTHPAWNQHHHLAIAPAISLRPLSRTEMDDLAAAYKVTDPIQQERVWKDTQGYPLLVHLWIEEALESNGEGGPGVGLLKRFHDRTTRWMNNEQKSWLNHVIFLNRVNVRSMTAMLGSEDEARRAFQWFESEGSVRDHQHRTYQVIEYVRSRLADYLEVVDPERFEALKSKGEKVSAAEKRDQP